MSRPLIDAHHLGLHQTGNEVWATNVLAATEKLGIKYDYAVNPLGHAVARTYAPSLAESQMHTVHATSALRLLYDLPRLVRRLSPSALLVHYTAPLAVTLPLAVLVHDCSFMYPDAKHWMSRRALARYRSSISLSVRRASVLLAPSDWVASDLRRFFNTSTPIFVAPNAVDPRLREAVEALPASDRNPPHHILFVGNPLPRKNLQTVAQALAILNRRGDKDAYKLVVVGGIDRRGEPAVRAAATLLGDSLLLTGRLSIAELAWWYRRCSALAYPSLNEGFGIPPIEAMTAGLPVVASNATCLPEVVGAGGALVDADDAEAWAATLEAVVAEAPTWSARGTRRSDDFSWSATATAVRDALDSVSP